LFKKKFFLPPRSVILNMLLESLKVSRMGICD
jgi:hypothetical protein